MQSFDAKKNITLPSGYESSKFKKRAKRFEWEHVVPLENFSRTFAEWRVGDDKCVKKNGKSFKGRNCANKMNIASPQKLRKPPMLLNHWLKIVKI
jgi:deoxyribonuclease-1